MEADADAAGRREANLMPDIADTNKGHARRVAKLLADAKNPPSSVLGGIWHWVNGVAHGIAHFIGGPFTSFARAVLNAIENVVDAYQETIGALFRVITWYDRFLWHTVVGWLLRLRQRTRADLMAQVKRLIRLIYVTTNTVLMLAYAAVRREKAERVRAISRAEASLRRDIRALHHTIEREAASGYRVSQQDRINLIVRLLDYAVLRNPALKAVVGDIVSGALDLLAVDNPVARLLLGFLIKHVISKLGVDKAVGTLASDLLAPLLGKPKPHDLHDVVLDLSDRAIAAERQWAKFFTDGGSQVEQAGREWRDITSVAGSLAIVAFTAEAVNNPQRWATAIADTVGTVANDVAVKAVTLFEGG